MDIEKIEINTPECINLLQRDIYHELQESRFVLDNFIKKSSSKNNIAKAALLLYKSFKTGGKVISCGNGGSHCDAMHFAEELTGKFRENRKAYPAIAISDPSHISCVANDFGYDEVFSRYIEALGNKDDVLFAITTSGNSINILKAIKKARENNLKVILLTGNSGGASAELADISIIVPHYGYADRIQEIHIKIIHVIILLIEKLMKDYQKVP